MCVKAPSTTYVVTNATVTHCGTSLIFEQGTGAYMAATFLDQQSFRSLDTESNQCTRVIRPQADTSE